MYQTGNGLLPVDILSSPSPSLTDGITADVEYIHRVFGSELIQEGGIMLQLSQVVITTAQNLLQRFYFRKSLNRYDVFTVAMGCLLLASKVEESPKVLREILIVYNHIYMSRRKLRRLSFEIGGERYTMWKNELIAVERIILKELGFSFYNIIDHPHKYLLYYIRVLNGSEDLAQRAWGYLNDSMRTDLSLRFGSHLLACAAVRLSAIDLNVGLPTEEGTEWWQIFDADLSTIKQIGSEIQKLYSLPKLEWIEPLCEAEYISDDLNTEAAIEDSLEKGLSEDTRSSTNLVDDGDRGKSEETSSERGSYRKNGRDRSRDREREGSSRYRSRERSVGRSRKRSRERSRRRSDRSRENDREREYRRYRKHSRSRDRNSRSRDNWSGRRGDDRR